MMASDFTAKPLTAGSVTERLAAFFLKCAEAAWEGGHLDGGAVQDEGVRLGLLVQVAYDPVLHGEADYEPGDAWYVLSPEIASLTKGCGDATS